MLAPGSIALTALLALLSGMTALNVDFYLPSMPGAAHALGAGGTIQLTISAYLIGVALGTPVFGPMADRLGRKPVLLGAVGIYCAGSAICALAPSIEVLIGGRILQGIGPSGMTVIARAIVRDLFEGTHMARQLSRIGTVTATGLLFLPVLGGLAETLFGWRAAFIALLAAGLLIGLTVWLRLPETIRARAPKVSLVTTLGGYLVILRNRSFVAHVAILSCGYLGLIAWVSSASLVLQNLYGLSPLTFSVVFVGASAGYLIGTAMAARYVMRIGIDRTIGLGVVILICGGLTMTTLVMLEVRSWAALVLPMGLYVIGMGHVFPQTIAGAMAPFRNNAGAAASLTGFIQQTLGAAIGVVAGIVIADSALPLAAMITLTGVGAFTIWLTTRRVRTLEGGVDEG